MIEKIIFTGDYFRPEQEINIEALSHVFEPLIKTFGLYKEYYISDINKRNSNDENITEWKNSFLNYHFSPNINKLKNSIVFGFEMSDNELELYSKLKIPWINFGINPLRFLDDLYFSIKTNMNLDFSSFEASEATISLCLKNIYSRYKNKSKCYGDALLIIGQTPFDKSVLINNDFKSLKDYSNEIDLIAKDYETVLYKPHPHQSCELIDKYILERYNAKLLSNENIYSLFINNPQIKICGINSSVLFEAKCFNLNVSFLERSKSKFDKAINYKLLIYENNFWEKVFNKRPKYNVYINLNYVPNNFLRNYYNSWSYVSEIDEYKKEISLLLQNEEQNREYLNLLGKKLDDLNNNLQNISTNFNTEISIINEQSKKALVESLHSAKISSDSLKQSIDAITIAQNSDLISSDALSASKNALEISQLAEQNSADSVQYSNNSLKASNEALKQSNEAFNFSKLADNKSDLAIKNSKLSDQISNEAKLISNSSHRLSEEAIFKAEKAAHVTKLNEERALKSLTLAQKSISIACKTKINVNKSIRLSKKSLNISTKIFIRNKNIHSKLIWYTLSIYSGFEKFIFSRYKKLLLFFFKL